MIDLGKLLNGNDDIEIRMRKNRYIINARAEKYINNFFYKGHNLYGDFYIVAKADNKSEKNNKIL